MDVRMPDGTIIQDVPEGTTKAQLTAKLAALKPSAAPAGNSLTGTAEALMMAGSGLVGGIAGQVAGVAKTLTGGQYGTQEGIRQGQETARSVSEAVTYRPRTEAGQELVDAVGKLIDRSKLAGMGPTEAVAAATLAGPAARQAGQIVRDIPIPQRAQPQMAGMGSAMTDVERLRTERAKALPVPLDLTKAMRSRDFEQQRFERETAKSGKLGEPLRERHADLNEKILLNFDAFVDQTGAEAGGLRAAGQIVNDAIVKKAQIAKGNINAAYDKARKSGEMQAPVDIGPLMQYVEQHQPEAINAPVISSLGAKLKQIAKDDGSGTLTATVNDVEEVRKMIGALSGKDATNAHFGKEIKGLIDTVTETVGGTDYRRARALRTRYAKEFEDVGVIDKLLRTKPGTADRAVAYEDVFKHSILSGSLDDVRAVRRTLQTGGVEGAQAWRELQGQTVQYIKDQVTANVATDTRGNPIVSAARLNRVITELDKDGKLDFVFGKTGAQQLRDISETAKDVMTFPPGSVNTSGTASVLLDAVGNAALGRLPTAAAQTISAVKQMRDASVTRQRVQEALKP